SISNGMFLVKGVSSFDKRMISRKGFQDFVRQNWKGKRGEQCRTMDRIRRCRGIMNWKNYSDLNSRDKFTRVLFTSSNPHDLESLFEGFRVRVTE
ncbi:hypothetical protein HID58_088350, partial [Brassica napus]